MPGRKKKKFIDKKTAVTFDLVHRSQRDPLQADDEAPQRVLLAADRHQENEPTADRKEEERKFGIFFDDDYDYLQHLKDVDELYDVGPAENFRLTSNTHPQEPRLTLPSSVFASAAETDVGLLNKAAPISGPRLDMDPDIVAAMDEDFDFENPENLLDDDFVLTANDGEILHDDDDCPQFYQGEDYEGVVSDNDTDEETFEPVRGSSHPFVTGSNSVTNNEEEHNEDMIGSDEADMCCSDDGDSEVGSLGDPLFDDFDTKTRFTNYSMTSSVIRRNAGLTLLDDRFEKMYEQYDDEEIGALDHEEIEGSVKPNSELLNAAIEQFEKEQEKQKLKDVVSSRKSNQAEPENGSGDTSSESDNDDDLVRMTIRKPQETWDCESILSTRSTLYNHPTLIKEPRKPNAIKMTKRAEIPIDTLPTRGLTLRQIESQETAPIQRVNTHRPKSETLEEKKERKQAVKQERKMRREEKKMNKTAFKAEQIRQHKEHLNIQQNLAGMAIT